MYVWKYALNASSLQNILSSSYFSSYSSLNMQYTNTITNACLQNTFVFRLGKFFLMAMAFLCAPLTLLYTGFFDYHTTHWAGWVGTNWPPHIISSITLPMLPKTRLNIFRRTKKHFVIFDFCLFFYDVIIFAWNFGEFPRSGNLAILKRCHVL